MFDVTPDDIKSLSDDMLRELVGRLAAAEVVRYGHSPLTVTWGGHHLAPDGGVDVRVDLPSGETAGPTLTRHVIGYQVKHEDMPRSKIIKEMRPGGSLRDVISELAAQDGAYVIVSAQGSTAYAQLEDRRQAIRDALNDCPDAGRLATDFYDRTRIATWVREHPGLVLWVREQVGRALDGWRPYANWSNPQEPIDAPYLVDDRVRIHFATSDNESVPVLVAIDRLRKMLRQPAAAVRLVGLSGVGKTRLVQALFDPTIGQGALPGAAVVYTDFHERHTNPQPEGMATQLLAQAKRAILIVDNCGAGTHARLTKLCQEMGSQISLLTIEYDVRDDTPEDTQVVQVDTASETLILELLHRRHRHLSPENATTIADVSGGNARIALAIAGTVGSGEKLAGLSAGEIFDRLFHQRQEQDDGLLRAAEACALLYSFDGEEMRWQLRVMLAGFAMLLGFMGRIAGLY